MAEEWLDLPLSQPLFDQGNEDAVVGYTTALENAFHNKIGGVTRFPGLRRFAFLSSAAKRIYLSDFNDDLMAADDKGQTYRVNRAATVSNVTGSPVSGGRRTIFAKTDRDLLLAAGGPIIRLRDLLTEPLSSDAPDATHVGWLDNFTIGIEVNSGRFAHSRPGEPDVWDVLDSFSADTFPDNINSMIVTPYRELMLGGVDSTEQFERTQSTAATETPFYRRWATGEGVKLPYAMIHADNALWHVNPQNELVRVQGQTSFKVSEPIANLLSTIDNWDEAWIGGYPSSPLKILGHTFIILQAPHASNFYGTKGVTIAYDIDKKEFFNLYGWDATNGVPGRWPGWSHWNLWDTTFVGGDDGWIYELTPDTYQHHESIQRFLVRTAHMAKGADVQVKGFRLRVVRGIGTPNTAPTIQVRCSRNGRPQGPPITRSLGIAGRREQFIEFGAFGNGGTFQFEISSAANCKVDLIAAQVKTVEIGH